MDHGSEPPSPASRSAFRSSLLTVLVLVSGFARADDAELVVLLDLDRDPATGCATETAEGTVPGIDFALWTIVDLDSRQVTSVSHSICLDPVVGVFGPEIAIEGSATPPWDTVDGDGTSGSTLIETYVPVSAMLGMVANAYFTLSTPVGSDALLDAPEPIILRSSAVPALPESSGALVAFALVGAALLGARKRLRMRDVLALSLLAWVSTPLLVRAGLGDGILRSWSESERIALDPSGDAPDGADILAAYVFVDPVQQLLFIRVDAFFGPAICLDWPTVDPGSGYSCNQEPPPDHGPFANRVALTFDDGPNLATTPTIVNTLRDEGIPATFFMVGNRLETAAARALAREIHDDPLFEVANHSYSHPRFTMITIDQARAQVGTTNELIRIAVGDACHYPSFFRIPYSASNCMSAGVVREFGLSMVGFHVDTLDWCYGAGNGFCSPGNASYLPDQYRTDMVGWTLTRLALYGGGVVIMHDSQSHTMAQLPALITALRNAGVTFVRLDDATVFPLINAAVNPPEAPACCDF